MLLAIEQGNTNTLFAVHDGERWIAQWRAATHSSRTADEYAVWLSQLLGMAGLALGAFDGCIISSVVPQSIFNLRNLARRYLHVEPMVIGENVDLGIPVKEHVLWLRDQPLIPLAQLFAMDTSDKDYNEGWAFD